MIHLFSAWTAKHSISLPNVNLKLQFEHEGEDHCCKITNSDCIKKYVDAYLTTDAIVRTVLALEEITITYDTKTNTVIEVSSS